MIGIIDKEKNVSNLKNAEKTWKTGKIADTIWRYSNNLDILFFIEKKIK